jgi:hypothetical protein
MDLDEAVAFYAAYNDALYDYEVAVRTAPDDVVAERLARTQSFLDPYRGTWVDTSASRKPGLTAEEVSARASKLSSPARPELFLVAEFPEAEWGSLFAGYVSGPHERTSRAYMYRFLAADIEGKPAIISQYSIEPSYGPPGEVTWDFTQGVQADLGRPVAARGLAEPWLDDQVEDYHRILREAEAT